MAILSYSAGAPLQGFLSWAQQQGMTPLCQPSLPNVLEILGRKLQWGTYAEAGDTIRYSAFLSSGDAVIDYGGQWADDAGLYKRYSHSLAVSSSTSPARAFGPASAGWYRDAAVSLQSGSITGQTLYVTQELGRTNRGAFAPIAMLAQGWLTSSAPVSDKPTAPPSTATTGGGSGGCCITSMVSEEMFGDTSIAYSYTVAAGQNARIVSINGGLITSGTAGNRLLTLQIDNGVWFTYVASAQAVQGAGIERGYYFAPGSPRYIDLATGTEYAPLPDDLWFDDIVNVTIQMDGVKTGDVLGNWPIVLETRG